MVYNLKRKRIYALPSTKRRKYMPKKKSAAIAVFLGSETKFYDSGLAAGSLVSSVTGAEQDPATNNCLNAILQGDGASERDGNRYVIKHISVKGCVNMGKLNDQTGPPSGQVIMVALVQDTQTNGTQLNSEDVFALSSVASVQACFPFVNEKFRSRFKILGWKTLQCNYDGGGTAASADYAGKRFPFTFSKPCNIKVQCNATTAPIASIVDNSIHVIAISSTVDTITPTIDYNSRIFFQG